MSKLMPQLAAKAGVWKAEQSGVATTSQTLWAMPRLAEGAVGTLKGGVTPPPPEVRELVAPSTALAVTGVRGTCGLARLTMSMNLLKRDWPSSIASSGRIPVKGSEVVRSRRTVQVRIAIRSSNKRTFWFIPIGRE